MFSMIRRRLTFANVAMTLALVFAMTGGAYAAKKYLITNTKQISPKVLKQLQGKNGKNGTNGTNGKDGVGSQGPQGPQGPQGEKGVKGDTGSAGPIGPTGTTGSPWTAGGTLPKGSTETGAWSVFSTSAGFLPTAVSFPIPLKNPLDGSHVLRASNGTGTGKLTEGSKTVTEVETTAGALVPDDKISGSHIPAGTTISNVEYEGAEKITLTLSAAVETGGTATGVALTAVPPTQCPGSVADPKAAEGYFCVYAARMSETVFLWLTFLGEPIYPPSAGNGVKGADKSGAILYLALLGSSGGHAEGTWAVTAP